MNGVYRVGSGPLASALSPPGRRLDQTMGKLLIPSWTGAPLLALVEGVMEMLMMPEISGWPGPTVQCNLQAQTQILHRGPPRSSPDQTCRTPGELSLPRKRALPRFAWCSRRAPSHGELVEPKAETVTFVNDNRILAGAHGAFTDSKLGQR